MIFTGYVLIILYILFLIFVVGNKIKNFFNVETSRKIIHVGLFFVWILIDIFLKNTIHQVIIPIIFIIVNFFSYKFKLFKSIERVEDNSLGTIYFAISITIIMLIAFIFPQTYYCSGIATFCLTFGDGFAALIGKNVKSKLLRNKKSLIGFISCFLFSTISICFFRYFYNLGLSILELVVIGLIVAIFELVDRGLDNFFIVAVSFFLSFVFLNYGLSNFVYSILLSEIIFLIVFLGKGLDYYGSIIAMVMCNLYMYFGGVLGVSILLGEYFFIFFISILKKIFIRNKKRDKERNYLQVLINGGLGSVFILLYGIFKVKILFIISIISLSGCFIDSVSSDIGTLSKNEPYDFIKRKRVGRGISGGISFLGTTVALICSFAISFIIYEYLDLPNYYILLVTVLIFFQTIIDTILGSLFQGKFKCVKCKSIIEKKIHCDKNALLIDGFSWVNNNVVNAISSIVTTIISVLILFNL